jgi:hypothetical protein
LGELLFLAKKINGALKKKMEHEQSLAIDNEKKEPIKIAKFIVIVFSLIGMYKSYEDGTFFSSLFPYTLLGLYDFYNYTQYTDFSNKFMKLFLLTMKCFYHITFFIIAIGLFNVIYIKNRYIYANFEGKTNELFRSYYLLIWVIIYYLFMGAELYLPIKRKRVK